MAAIDVIEIDLSAVIEDGVNTATVNRMAAQIAFDGTARAILALNKEPITVVNSGNVVTGVIGGGECCIGVDTVTITPDDAVRNYCESIGLCY